MDWWLHGCEHWIFIPNAGFILYYMLSKMQFLSRWAGYPKKSNPIFDLDKLCENWSLVKSTWQSALSAVMLRWSKTLADWVLPTLSFNCFDFIYQTIDSLQQETVLHENLYVVWLPFLSPLEYHRPIILWHQIGVYHSHTLYTGKFYS